MTGLPQMIPLHTPDLGGNCAKYAQQVLEAGHLWHGPFLERLEAEVARRLRRRYAVALSSGTAALHLGLLGLGVGPGDEVLVSDLTFVAPANAVRYCGARPLFVDADATWQMGAKRLADWLQKFTRPDNVNSATGRPLRAILPVHILGGGGDMPRIMAAARAHGLAVLEDASQALGTEIAGRLAGSYGDAAVLSFNANKTVAGPGGMLLTDDAEYAQRARYLAWQARDGPGYIHREVGYNYRMGELQAALILGQLERLEEILAAKRAVADAYQEVLGGLPGVAPMPVPDGVRPSWWLWTAIVPDRRRLQAALWRAGIESRPLWQPMHTSPAHAGYCLGEGAVAAWVYRRALSFPSSPGLSREGALRVAQVARDFLLDKR